LHIPIKIGHLQEIFPTESGSAQELKTFTTGCQPNSQMVIFG